MRASSVRCRATTFKETRVRNEQGTSESIVRLPAEADGGLVETSGTAHTQATAAARKACVDFLLGRRGELVPPRYLNFAGDGDFEAAGDEFLRYFVEFGRLPGPSGSGRGLRHWANGETVNEIPGKREL